MGAYGSPSPHRSSDRSRSPHRLAPKADPGHEKVKESPPENASDREKQKLREQNARKKEKDRQEQEKRIAAESQGRIVKIGDKHYYNGCEVEPVYPDKNERYGNDPLAHMEEVKDKVWTCILCPPERRKFGEKGNVKQHVLSKHMGITPMFYCPIPNCVSKPDVMHNVNQHLKRHVGNMKRWKCLIVGCKKSEDDGYADNKNLIAHCLNIHGLDHFKCCRTNYCFYAFFAEHMAEMHPGKEMPKEALAMKAREEVNEESINPMEEHISNNGEDCELDQELIYEDSSPNGRNSGSNQTHDSVQRDDSVDQFNEELINEVIDVDHSSNGQDSGPNRITGVMLPNGDGRYRMRGSIWLNGQSDGPYKIRGEIWRHGQSKVEKSYEISGHIWRDDGQDDRPYKIRGDVYLNGLDDGSYRVQMSGVVRFIGQDGR